MIARNILFQCSSFVEERDIGVALMAPVDLVIQREPLRVRQPDILFLSSQRAGIRGRAQLRVLQNLELPPDLVVEVLFPSNTRRDIEAKLQDYRQVGVRECWLVSSEAETVEAIDLAPDTLRSLGIYGVEGELHSRVLPGFTLRLRQIFE